MPAHDLDALRSFRSTLHGCCHRRADALVELVDARLAGETVTALPPSVCRPCTAVAGAASTMAWPVPTDKPLVADAQYGTVRVRSWSCLHPKQQVHPGRGTRKPRPIVRGTLVLVEVSRLPARPYAPQALWLWWAGPGAPDLEVLWRAYVRRFDLEHTLRCCKQSLGWTVPRVRHPEQADRWTWLVVAAYTQLRLARLWVADRPLPWERRLDPDKLTPTRVRRAVSGLLAVVGTPARGPKPCGRSPGRPTGSRSGRATRYPALKKAA